MCVLITDVPRHFPKGCSQRAERSKITPLLFEHQIKKNLCKLTLTHVCICVHIYTHTHNRCIMYYVNKRLLNILNSIPYNLLL